MLKRAFRWIGWSFEAIPFFGMMGLFRVLGLDAGSALGGFLARTLGPISPTHRLAHRNIARALPHLTLAERRAVITGMWNNLGRTLAEYPHFHRFKDFPNARITVTGLENAQAALARGKGAILTSGHFANWELMALSAYRAGLDGAELYRPVNNRIIDRWIVRQRRTYAYPNLVSKTGNSARELLRTLKDGKSIALLADQKHREGDAIPFFGRDAMTVTGPAVMSLRTGAAIVPVTMVRTKGARFDLAFHPEMQIERTGDKSADQRAILLTINQWLEQAIAANPTMWLWAHDRWLERG